MRNPRMLTAALLAWTALIAYFTLMPAEYLADYPILGYDKLGHFGIFGGWTGLYGLFRPERSPAQVFIIGFAFSVLIEALQFWLPINRSAEVLDLVANLLGCLAATGIIMLLRKNPRFT